MHRSNYKLKKRIIILFVIILIIFILLSLRLVWIQVVNSEFYQHKALDQRLRFLKVEPQRGIIFDCNGKKMAVSASSDTVVAIPIEIQDKENTAAKLADVLAMDYETVYKRITRNASAVYIKRKIEEDKVEEVRKLDLPGITFTEENKRYYPKEETACHILGFSGIDNQGLDGIELSYDNYLQGIPGKITAERDAAGRTIPEGVQEYISPRNGDNIYLTIDEVIQYIAERELNRAMKEYNISGGTIIVMEPDTGSILALANRPSYNPNNFADYPQKYWRNRAISDSYEPGSTFKIITTAAALEEGVVNENDIFNDPGHIIVSGERINCWKAGGHGQQTFAEVVQNSCNTGFVQVGMRLGKAPFYNYIKAFNFGNETGIKLPGEANGLVYDYDQIGPVELATMTFGHGITVTPIQLITAVSAVANDGMMLRPRLVKEIRNTDGELVKENVPVPIRQVISEDTARRTRKLLQRVVDEGTGRSAKIEGYKIGGKTGTAKHYGEEIYDSSFIGIIPVEDPQLVILVVLYDVEGTTYYGSQTATPIFRNIALDTLRYLEIPPQLPEDKDKKEIEIVSVPDVTNIDINEAIELLRKKRLDVRLIGDKKKVLKQVPLPGAKINVTSTVILYTEDNITNKKYYIAVPDLKGMSAQEARNILAELGLKLNTEGSGKIVKQDIEPGVRIPGGSTISVILKK